jgi:hypothetical protein
MFYAIVLLEMKDCEGGCLIFRYVQYLHVMDCGTFFMSILMPKFKFIGNYLKWEMRRMCSTYLGEEMCIQGFGGET